MRLLYAPPSATAELLEQAFACGSFDCCIAPSNFSLACPMIPYEDEQEAVVVEGHTISIPHSVRSNQRFIVIYIPQGDPPQKVFEYPLRWQQPYSCNFTDFLDNKILLEKDSLLYAIAQDILYDEKVDPEDILIV